MKFTIISDTHNHHHEIEIPQGDVLIHAGDITERGHKEEVIDFLEWFSKQPHPHKIFIGGNHDIYMDRYPVDLLELIPENVIYLRNNGLTINKLKIWGSPVTPDFMDWSFGKERSKMDEHWKYMPEDIDILITHTPPYGILDQSSQHISLGCKFLLKKVKELKPKYHIFGHIHASYGIHKTEATTFINASIINSVLGPVNKPIIFEI